MNTAGRTTEPSSTFSHSSVMIISAQNESNRCCWKPQDSVKKDINVEIRVKKGRFQWEFNSSQKVKKSSCCLSFYFLSTSLRFGFFSATAPLPKIQHPRVACALLTWRLVFCGHCLMEPSVCAALWRKWDTSLHEIYRVFISQNKCRLMSFRRHFFVRLHLKS